MDIEFPCGHSPLGFSPVKRYFKNTRSVAALDVAFIAAVAIAVVAEMIAHEVGAAAGAAPPLVIFEGHLQVLRMRRMEGV